MERVPTQLQLLGTRGQFGINRKVHPTGQLHSRMSSRQQDVFMTVTNKDCKDLYVENTASHFRVCLDEYVDWTDTHTSCALLGISCTTQDVGNQSRDIYICCNLVTEQRVGKMKQSLLRRCLVRRDKYQFEEFAHPYYIPLKSIRGNYLEIYIKGDDGEAVSFLKGLTTCTLHFRK